MNAELYEKTVRCIRCGFCLEACPTFVITGQETESPRGRIYLVRSAIEGELQWNKEVEEHLDTCLGCRACETACPSGVEYGSILEMARAELNDRKVRPFLSRLARGFLRKLLTTPHILKLATRTGIQKMPQLFAKLIGVKKVEAEMPRPQKAVAFRLSKSGNPVYFLEGCVMSAMFAETNANTKSLIGKCGDAPISIPGCCGALELHDGRIKAARAKARKIIDTCADGAPIVTNSAGCGSAMKEYDELLKGDPIYAERAADFSRRVQDISQYLCKSDQQPSQKPLPLKVAYHDACHLAHGQRIRKEPRLLLERIPSIQLVELEESDRCCGSAGIYNITEPELARQLLDRKWKFIEESGAEIIATGNPGCLAWIAQAAREKGSDIKVMHTVDVLAMAIKD
jgi:glycolate oxidase iron-sulfur subunit